MKKVTVAIKKYALRGSTTAGSQERKNKRSPYLGSYNPGNG
jgi:hypothetical protein